MYLNYIADSAGMSDSFILLLEFESKILRSVLTPAISLMIKLIVSRFPSFVIMISYLPQNDSSKALSSEYSEELKKPIFIHELNSILSSIFASSVISPHKIIFDFDDLKSIRLFAL